ncbi:hypothetical protein PMIN03_012848 [Paraphaeosphaeria minitans]
MFSSFAAISPSPTLRFFFQGRGRELSQLSSCRRLQVCKKQDEGRGEVERDMVRPRVDVVVVEASIDAAGQPSIGSCACQAQTRSSTANSPHRQSRGSTRTSPAQPRNASNCKTACETSNESWQRPPAELRNVWGEAGAEIC